MPDHPDAPAGGPESKGPSPLPWQRPGPNMTFAVGDQYLVALAVSRNDRGQSTRDIGPKWHWEYHVITATEDGFDNSDGDAWCSWTWDDVEWFIHEKDLKPLESL